MAKINIDRDKAELLFYKFGDLGYMVTRMHGIVQNPDFADTRDIEIFKENCRMFEKEYEEVKNGVVELFDR